MSSIERTGQKRNLARTFSSWEFLYFKHLKQIQNIIVDVLEERNDEDEGEFDLIYIRSIPFLIQLSKFIYKNSSKHMNNELYGLIKENDYEYQRYLAYKNETKEGETENGNENGGVEDDMDSIFSKLSKQIEYYINYNKLFIYEDGSSFKLFNFFLSL